MSPPRLDPIDEMLVRRITSMLFIGKLHRRSPGYYREAGLALLMLRTDKPGQLWARIVREHCGISPRRAYELMQLGASKSLEALRKETSARVRKHRKSKWLPTKAPRQKGTKEHISCVTAGVQHGQSSKVRLPGRRQQTARAKHQPRKP
jgi:hypothetical protein